MTDALWIVGMILILCLCHYGGEAISNWEMARARKRRKQ